MRRLRPDRDRRLLLAAAVLAGLGLVVPALLGYERYVIVSGSMSGTYDRGSLVFDEVVPVRGPARRRRDHLPAAAGRRPVRARDPPDRRDRADERGAASAPAATPTRPRTRGRSASPASARRASSRACRTPATCSPRCRTAACGCSSSACPPLLIALITSSPACGGSRAPRPRGARHEPPPARASPRSRSCRSRVQPSSATFIAVVDQRARARSRPPRTSTRSPWRSTDPGTPRSGTSRWRDRELGPRDRARPLPGPRPPAAARGPTPARPTRAPVRLRLGHRRRRRAASTSAPSPATPPATSAPRAARAAASTTPRPASRSRDPAARRSRARVNAHRDRDATPASGLAADSVIVEYRPSGGRTWTELCRRSSTGRAPWATGAVAERRLRPARHAPPTRSATPRPRRPRRRRVDNSAPTSAIHARRRPPIAAAR